MVSVIILKYEADGIDRCEVYVHTLGLGDHFGSTAPPAVHHRSAGAPRAARTLSPGTNATWTTKKRTWRSREAALTHKLNQRGYPQPWSEKTDRWRPRRRWVRDTPGILKRGNTPQINWLGIKKEASWVYPVSINSHTVTSTNYWEKHDTDQTYYWISP